MKKKIIFIIIFIVLIGSGVLTYFLINKDLKKIEVDTKISKFKQEYESLNGKENQNGKKYMEISIPDNNKIKYKTEEEIADIIKNKTGVIYLGYPECPWCRNMVPVLIDAAKQTGISDIYYLNMHDVRDKKSLDENGKIVVEEQGTEGYKKIIEALGKYADVYDGLNDDSIKRIYVPIVIFVKDGEIVAVHKDTVKSQTDPYVPLNDEQKKELLDIYKDGMHKVLDDLCDTSC